LEQYTEQLHNIISTIKEPCDKKEEIWFTVWPSMFTYLVPGGFLWKTTQGSMYYWPSHAS